MSLTLSTVLSVACLSAPNEAFTHLGTLRAPGGSFSFTVGPGPTPGSERFYTSYLYLNDTLEVVAIDPATGEYESFPNPAPGEYGSRSMVLGPDGSIYVGTLPNAHLLRLDPGTGALVDLGRPSASETFVWDMAFAQDGKLYGGTQPNGHLFSYDPANGGFVDLGRLDPTQSYVRFVAASDDGFVYAGLGSTAMDVVAYEIATGKRQSLLPAISRTAGFANVYRADDGRVYAVAGSTTFSLSGFVATPTTTPPARPYPNRLRDGSRLKLDGRDLVVVGPDGKTVHRPYRYPGRELPLYRIGLGPDGKLYGSSVLPAWLVRIDPGKGRLEPVGALGDGEVYQFVAQGNRLLMGGYGVGAPVLSYDPAQPFDGGPSGRNPTVESAPGVDPSWRPQGAVQGPDGKAYLGATPGYGKLGGPLVRWDGKSSGVEVFPSVVPDQSVVSLSRWGSFIVGGTSIQGGGGTKPTQTSAVLFVWDPATRNTTLTVVPVPGAPAIENVVVTPAGLALGIAEHRLFVVDLTRRKVVFVKELPFRGGVIYSGMAIGPDGRIWGLAAAKEAGIFVVDPASYDVKLVAQAPEPITAGLVLRDGALFFASGARVYRYELPLRP
jgi:hypothetical protein